MAPATAEHLPGWLALRADLWGDDPDAAAELAAMLVTGGGFVAVSDGAVVGFAEAALRHDYVNGCDTSPVLFLEGLFVAPGHRRRGLARALVAAVADWGRAQECCEFASDALLDNMASHAMHRALGFAETERVVCFRRLL